MSILTKGTLIRRDIPLLVKAARRVHVDIQMSIAMYDDALQKAIEPGAPTTQARLDTVRAQRVELEHRVQLLHDGTLEKDMLDEQARRALNVSQSDEITIMRPLADTR